MEIEINPAREAAADYLGEVLVAAFDSLDLEIIQEEFGVDLEEAMTIFYEIGAANAAFFWDDEIIDPLADVVEGDVDPTFEYGDDYDICVQRNGTYACTRLDGHIGQHVAGDGVEVCATWS